MLQNLHKTDTDTAEVKITSVDTYTPFKSGLEYSCSARGTWTIAHTSMLIPHCHQIFVCPEGCLRGVVLSAAEYGGLDRFSMVTVKEEDFVSGKMEHLFIDGITDILTHLSPAPPAALIYSCCIHQFMGVDLAFIFRTLRERFPKIDIIDCYMNPTMRKSKYSPDELMRRQLYSALEMMPKNQKSVNVIGNDFAFDTDNELAVMLKDAGYTLRDIVRCREYSEYKKMAESIANIYIWPAAYAGAVMLEEKLQQKALSLPVSYDYEEIDRELEKAAGYFNAPLPDLFALREAADRALERAHLVIGDMPVEIDYTATARPLGLAVLLFQHGFHVTAVYTDSVMPGEEKAVDWLKVHYPDLPVRATINFRNRIMQRDSADKNGGRLLAIGQKAAYYSGTEYFVNMIQMSGLHGYHGIITLAGWMEEASRVKKDTRKIISVKGSGCSG